MVSTNFASNVSAPRNYQFLKAVSFALSHCLLHERARMTSAKSFVANFFRCQKRYMHAAVPNRTLHRP